MVLRFITKAAALLIAAIILAIAVGFAVAGHPDWHSVGIYTGCGLLQRCSYSFYHASLLHAALNLWCFLSLSFLYDVSPARLAIAFGIAVAAPPLVLVSTPTVGLSAVCFALLGLVAFQVRRKIYWQSCIALYILIGFLFPAANGAIHLYSYVAGLIVGLLNAPLPCRKLSGKSPRI